MKKPTVGKISEAKRRVNAAQAAKKTVVRKPGAKPVFKPNQPNAPVQGLSLREMLRETTSETRKFMKIGNVTVIALRVLKSGRTLLGQTVTNHPGNKPNTYYKQAIRNEDPAADTFSKSRRLKVDCTCPRFKYVHDYALYEKEASDLKRSIDEPPDMTNPGPTRNLGICKHILSLFNVIVKSRR